MDMQGVSLSTTSSLDVQWVDKTLDIPIRLSPPPTPAVWACKCIHFHSQQYGRARCIPYHWQQYGRESVSISTASYLDEQGVSLSTTSSMDLQCVSLSAVRSMNSGCIPFHYKKYEQWTCMVYPFPP